MTSPRATEIRADRLDLLLMARRWSALADDLESCGRLLDGVPVTGLGGRVAPVAGRVLDGWSARVTALHEAAQVHHDAVLGTWRELKAGDDTAAGLFGAAGGSGGWAP